MQIEALQVFCDVARLKSFSKSAETHRVTQSTASQAVHQLEARLGVELIDRSHRPFRLTREGKAFYEGCREILERYHDLESKVRQIREEQQTTLRVASIYSAGLRHMREYIQRFGERYPATRVQLEFLHPDRVYQVVVEEEADLGIVSYPQARREITVVPWREEEMALALPPSHRLAGLKEARLSEIGDENFVHFDRGLVVRREIDRFLKAHGIEVNVVLEFDNIEAIKRAVEVGSGISILPLPTFERELAAGTMAIAHLGSLSFRRPLALIHRRGRRMPEGLQHFIEMLLAEKMASSPLLVAS